MFELNIGEPGVCMASVSEAKKAITELKGEKPLAILCAANIDMKEEEGHVLVEDPSGRWQTRRRFVFVVSCVVNNVHGLQSDETIHA